MKNILKDLKKKKYLTEQQFSDLNLKAEPLNLFNRILQIKKSKKNFRKKYPAALRKFALTLNYYSSAAYKYVRRVFHTALPHPRVLAKWYQNSSMLPGFTKQAFDILKQKSNLSRKKIICGLIVDEMALRHQTQWTGKNTEGLVNYGSGPSENKEIATEAFVFILVCLSENWKIPVAYFFVKGLSSETRATLIMDCLRHCHAAGVDVVSLTFDGCAANLSTAAVLGCKLSVIDNLKTTFKHPETNKEVALFLDPCHMIKLVRNTFEAKSVIFNNENKEIRWQLLKNLNKLQTNQGLNFANRLTQRHLNFRNEIMKVKLATQLLSRSVANALQVCEETLRSSNFKDSGPTKDFIILFNDLFDIFNSRARDKFGFKKPVSSGNAKEIFAFLEKAKKYILELRIYNKNRITRRGHVFMKITKKKLVQCKSKTGFLGFLICIESLKYLYASLVQDEERLSYISTYRLSQDHIEIMFGDIRRHGGYNNNPNTIQFKGIYKKMFNHLELRSAFTGNCIPVEYFPILNCSSAVKNINNTCNGRVLDENLVMDELMNLESDKKSEENVSIMTDLLNNDRCSCNVEQIIGYISGWVSRKLCGSLKCEDCRSSLFTNEKLWFHKLVTLKDMGGLCFASHDVFLVCLKSEDTLKKFIIENGPYFRNSHDFKRLQYNILKHFLQSNVFDILSEHSMNQTPILNHRLQLIRAIIQKYLNVRLHHEHKNNPFIKSTSKRQKRNKLNLFEGK
ncbi:hypothetical protein PYW08_006005 [Mythimna loreyi]|uniref:Uncharacterized protein n=1 Tax=Mythimna loreyi TaxID=667449 RepID=A0ACC2QQE3_9NEOP|nr:hypothetical protein PYW08_006005 [Mythimna loreyi]